MGPLAGKRILVFIDDGSYTFDNRVQRETKTLRRAGAAVTVVCPRYPGDALTEVTAEGVRVLRFPKLRAGSGLLGHAAEYASSLVFGFLRTLEAALFRGGFDAFQACNPPDHLFLVALPFRLFGKRFVFDHHDLVPELFLSRFGGTPSGATYRALLLAERLSLRLADGVIATNESYRRTEIARGGIPPERVAVVRNGPDLGKFAPSEADDGSGPTAPPFRVGYLGNMNPQDGVDVFVRAAALVAARRSDVEFVLVGSGDAFDSLRKLAASLSLGGDRIRFLGRVGDAAMLEALRSCHVCVQPDPWSPLNAVSTMNKPMEYMALRRAVLAFDLEETRVSCGDAALLVPHEGGAAALAAGIERLVDDGPLRARLARAGRARVEETLRWERSEPALLALYERVLARRERRAVFLPILPRFRDAVSRRLFWPFATRAIAFNRRTAAASRAAESVRRLPPPERERARLESLRSLLVFCRDRVPYYRRLFREAGFRPESIERLTDLRDVPPLDKKTLRERRDELVPEGARRDAMTEVWSGGSTGEPVSVLMDADGIARGAAALLWSDGLAGWMPGCRTACLWGAPSDVRLVRGARARLRAFLWNRELFDTFDVAPGRLARYHEALEAFAPDVLVAYASSAFLLARHLLETGAKPRYPRRAVVTSAETLTPAMRRTIESVFPARVFDRYGSREAGVMAAECPAHDGLHVNAADFVLEGVDPFTLEPSPEGEAEILVTALAARGTPLVRYRIGDMAEFAPDARCACGETGTKLARVVGRVSDTITAPDGTLVHGEWFTHLLYGVPGVRQFRFVQSAPRRFRLEVAADPGAPGIERGIASVAAAIRARLGGSAEVEVLRVEDIAPAASGKRRFTVSHVEIGGGLPSRAAEARA